MKVKNINGEQVINCGCDSWLTHWENNSGSLVHGLCSAKDCEKEAEVGGHVEIIEAENDWEALKSSKPSNIFIIPICRGCNAKYGQAYEVKPRTIPVSTEKTDQCGQ